MITKEEFAAQAERGAAMLSALPVTKAILYYLSDQLKKGDPPWWKKTLKAWEKRKFVAWSEAWSLFVTCLHFEALNDDDNPLVSYFPSCGGTAEADPSSALNRFLSAPPDSFFTNLKTGHRRYHSQATGGAWRMAADCFFGERELPYYLVEVDAGAGLNLAADLLYATGAPFDSDLIQARIGLDSTPLLVQDIVQRRWLAAAVFPDMTPVMNGLGEAVEKMADYQRKDPTFVQLVKCDPVTAPKFVAKNIPADDSDLGLLIFNALTTGRMTDDEYNQYAGGIADIMEAWGDRAIWFEAETVRGELYSATIRYSVARLAKNALTRINFGWVDFASNQYGIDLKIAKKFLGTAKTS
ncbi:MAG: DUF2332 family protein [Elusimicrobia bacterium]|nr:DUF2332 family protein [Elusimicrobiota bacterium]